VFTRFSFRHRLLLWIMPILVCGLSLLSIGTYLYVSRLIEQEFTSNMLAMTGKSAEGMDTWLRTLILEPETIAATPAAKAINSDFGLIDALNVNRHKLLHDKYPDVFQDIYAANRQGEYHTVFNKDGKSSIFIGNIANRPYFQSIMAGGSAQITPPLVSRTTGIPTLFMVAPITNERGGPEGLVGAGISLSYIRTLAEGLKAYQTGYGVVIAQDGTLIYHPDSKFVMQKKISEFEDQSVRELGEQMVAGRSGIYRYIYHGQKKMAFYQPIPITGWSLATVVPESELFASAVRLLWVMVGITLLLTVVVGLVILAAANRLSRPLLDLADHARLVAAGNMEPGMLTVAHQDEIGTLADNFNTMTCNLKNSMETLQRSETKFRSLIDNINVGIYRTVIRPAHALIQANTAMVRMLGYESEADLMTARFEDLFNEPWESSLLVNEIRHGGFVRDKEVCLQKKDGVVIWCAVNANAEYDNEGDIKYINGFMEEITERKRLAEQLRQSQKMEAIGTLAGGVAHDFNNILTGIIGYANLCKLQMEDNPLAERYLDDILEAAERAAHLTKSLLTFSRQHLISLDPVNLNDTVHRMERLLRRVIGEDIELSTQLCEDDLVIMADNSQLEQIIVNLAANARDAMPDGGRLAIHTQRTEIQQAAPALPIAPGTYATLTVADSGQGMDETTRQRVFEPFFTTKDVGKGTGLGLSIVYGIVQQHAGTIEVTSEPGNGTIFEINFRLVDLKAKQIVEMPTSRLARGTETILVAEDDVVVRRLFKAVLEDLGYKVIEAVDGEEAIEQYFAHADTIDLLLFDVVMPKRNGKDAYQVIRQVHGGVPVLFSSGYTSDILSQKGLDEEGADLICKPLDPRALAAKVRAVLDKNT
jgi:PAS domain S-box-containing protein